MKTPFAGFRASLGVLPKEGGVDVMNYRTYVLIGSVIALGISGVITLLAAGSKSIRVSASAVTFAIPHAGSAGMIRVGVIAGLSALPLLLYFEVLAFLAGKALNRTPTSVGVAFLGAVRRTPAALGSAVIPIILIFILWASLGLWSGGSLSAAWMILLVVAAVPVLLVFTAWMAFVAAGAIISVLAHNSGILAAIQNSWLISCRHTGYIIGKILFLGFLDGLIAVLIGAPFFIVARYISGESGPIVVISVTLAVIGQCVSGAYGLASVSLDVIRLHARVTSGGHGSAGVGGTDPEAYSRAG